MKKRIYDVLLLQDLLLPFTRNGYIRLMYSFPSFDNHNCQLNIEALKVYQVDVIETFFYVSVIPLLYMSL